MRTSAYPLAAVIAATQVGALDNDRQCLGGQIQLARGLGPLWLANAQEWQCGQIEFKNGKTPPQMTLKGNASSGKGWIAVPGVPSIETGFWLDGLDARLTWTTDNHDHFLTIFRNGTAEFGKGFTDEKPREFAHCIAIPTDHQHTRDCLERAYEHCMAVDPPPGDESQYYEEQYAEFRHCMEDRDAQ